MVAHAQTIFTFSPGASVTQVGAPGSSYIFQGKGDVTTPVLSANAVAAAASFDAIASGPGVSSELINFNAMAPGTYAGGTALLGATGVTLSATNMDADPYTPTGFNIANASTPTGGFNTTGATTGTSAPGNYLFIQSKSRLNPATVTFSFSPNVTGFGAMFTGVGTGTGSLTYTDGNVVNFDLGAAVGSSPGAGANVGADGFFGLFNFAPGKSIASLTITNGTTGGTSEDIFGIDDIRIVRGRNDLIITPTPEPGAIITGLSMVGMTGLGLVRGRRRKVAA